VGLNGIKLALIQPIMFKGFIFKKLRPEQAQIPLIFLDSSQVNHKHAYRYPVNIHDPLLKYKSSKQNSKLTSPSGSNSLLNKANAKRCISRKDIGNVIGAVA